MRKATIVRNVININAMIRLNQVIGGINTKREAVEKARINSGRIKIDRLGGNLVLESNTPMTFLLHSLDAITSTIIFLFKYSINNDASDSDSNESVTSNFSSVSKKSNVTADKNKKVYWTTRPSKQLCF